MHIWRLMISAESIFGTGPHWDHWPFGPGYGNWLASATRLIFVVIILLAIFGYLRLLFGPKGFFRDKELDREAEEERKRELEELEEKFKSGRMDESLYKMKKRELER